MSENIPEVDPLHSVVQSIGQAMAKGVPEHSSLRGMADGFEKLNNATYTDEDFLETITWE